MSSREGSGRRRPAREDGREARDARDERPARDARRGEDPRTSREGTRPARETRSERDGRTPGDDFSDRPSAADGPAARRRERAKAREERARSHTREQDAESPRDGEQAGEPSGERTRDERSRTLSITLPRLPKVPLPEPVEHLLEKARGVSRLNFLYGMFGVAFLAVSAKLFWLQTFKSGEYASLAKEERTARVTLPSKRGAIYDRNGVVLAQSVDATTIYAMPMNVATADINPIANLLAERLGGQATEYAGKLTGTGSFAYIAKRVDPDVAASLKQELSDRKLQGVYFISDSKRVYPMGQVAGNLIGCVGEEGHGLTGLELYYDDVLTGTDGYLIQERSRDGAPIAGGQNERTDPQDGTSIVIAIDVDVQRKAEEELTTTIADWKCGDGVAIVMQPETGEILACASTPLLDPSDLSSASSDALKLRGVTDSYEPGSTTKPITASMAIDLGLATPDTTYYAPWQIQVGTDWVSDADHRRYDMDMSLTNMLERSSNVGAVLCAESVGAQNFSEYLAKYKIGTKTGVDYPGEATGIVPTLENYTGAWMAMAYGQSFAVPPMQMARAIAAIANEGVMLQPHFLVSKGGEEMSYPAGERVIATATAEQVDWMMDSVVKHGFGYTGAIDGYNLAAKTGTSERLDPNTGTYAKDSFVVSFMGFGPTEDPKALVYILFDEVDMDHEGTSAGGPWAGIMGEALTKLGVAPSS